MTLKEAKKEADKIGGVVDWWWNYSVYTAKQWYDFHLTHGYGVYVSKGAEKYFHQKYLEWKKKHDAMVAEVRRKIKAGISPWTKWP